MWFLGCKDALIYICVLDPDGELSALPLITIIAITFCCNNLWKSKLMVLERRPGKFFVSCLGLMPLNPVLN